MTKKIIASMLIASSLILSSPGIILADELPQDSAETQVVAEQSITSPVLDAAPIDEQSPPADVAGSNDVFAQETPQTQQTDQTTGQADTSLANDPSSSNDTTGADSTNTSTTTVNNQTDITNENYADVFNDSFLAANTGDNTANYNTGSGIITTNSAEGDGQLLNVLNKNSVQLGGNGTPSPDNATNNTTGAGSANASQTNINNQLTVRNINDARAINRITANINSGRNNANFNTGHGITTTGSANLGLNFFSLANTNLFGTESFYANLQNIYDDFSGNVDLSGQLSSGSSPLSSILANAANQSTGADSSNQAIVNINDQTSITNQNTGNLNNVIDANVISGQNKANYNTGTGSIVSGQVNSSVNAINFLNSNITSGKVLLKTLNVFGDWSGDLKLPTMQSSGLSATQATSATTENSNTGAGSNNETNSATTNTTNITNSNRAVIQNNVAINADSGTNDASYNGGAGLVKIGSSRTETNEMNVANLNVTGQSWWLIVVNRFGNWNGTAVGSPDAVAIKTTGISTVLTPLQSGVAVTNNSTGPQSDNEAGVTINHQTDIINTNDATITNSLNINAISGQNEAKYNTGHGYIETGDIRGVNNIINFANANIAVADWTVVVVNVFGNWDGDLVFNTPNGGTNLPVGGSLSCPVFDFSGSTIASANNTTGADSTNASDTTANNTNTATNNNTANINNTTNASATTGQNSADYNTGSGSVTTGQAQTGSSVANQANTNGVNGQQGSGPGVEQSANNATGADSDNTASATTNNNTTATNNNDTTADNNVSGQTNTGQNSSSYNTGAGAVDTSWASTFLDLRNQVNDNQLTLQDLTSTFNQTPVAPGQEAELPNDNSSSQSCPGVTIVVSPASASMQTNGSQTFTVVANDPLGNPITHQPAFTWTATGGTIDSNGVFTAGTTAGTFAVTATAEYGNQGTAVVVIAEPASENNDSQNNTGNGSGTGGSGANSGNTNTNSNTNTNTNTNPSSSPVTFLNTDRLGGGGGGGGGSNTQPSYRKGDYNNDGKVDDLDFSILMANWGLKRTGLLAAQNGDGIVDDTDLSIIMSNWSLFA